MIEHLSPRIVCSDMSAVRFAAMPPIAALMGGAFAICARFHGPARIVLTPAATRCLFARRTGSLSTCCAWNPTSRRGSALQLVMIGASVRGARRRMSRDMRYLDFELAVHYQLSCRSIEKAARSKTNTTVVVCRAQALRAESALARVWTVDFRVPSWMYNWRFRRPPGCRCCGYPP